MLQTTNSDVTGMEGGSLRDDLPTRVLIPSRDSPQQFLHVRFSWPLHGRADPNYRVYIKGEV